MKFPLQYKSVCLTNFASFYSEGIMPAGTEGVVVDYNFETNTYLIESAFPDETLIGGHRYDVTEVERDDFEVIK